MKLRLTILIVLGLTLVSCNAGSSLDPSESETPASIVLPPKWTPTASVSQDDGHKEALGIDQPVGLGSPSMQSTSTPEHTTPQTPRSSPTRPPQPPSFSNLVFATVPDVSEKGSAFPSGTHRVYAMWEYSNMREGMIIRRDWSFNNVLWLVREEPWDYQKYGSSGLMKDVFIYDDDNGLEPGNYTLDLFVDGINIGRRSGFIVLGWVINPLPSLDGSKKAIVKRPGTIIIQDPDGKERVLLETDEIQSMAWFPDGKHIVYTIVDRSSQFDPWDRQGLKFELWMINVNSAERRRLSTADERLRDPLVSPNGRYIAAIAGSGYGDACLVDKDLVIFSLNQEFRRVATYELEDFSGIVLGNPDDFWLIYPGGRYWHNSTNLQVEIRTSCLLDFEVGVYRLDLTTLHAEIIADLDE